MFTIKTRPSPKTGYSISTGDGQPVEASNVEELQAAVGHYFGNVEHEPATEKSTCPFCRWMASTGKRRAV